MFCPKCAEKQPFEETQFCTRCGFPTRGVRRLLENGGQTEKENQASSREQGIRRGVKIILLGLILLPAYFLLAAMFPPDDRLVESSPSTTWFEQIGSAILWMIFLTGAARIGYAMVFGRKSAAAEDAAAAPTQSAVGTAEPLNSAGAKSALPPSSATPVSDFGRWRTTGELFDPVFSKPRTSGELK